MAPTIAPKINPTLRTGEHRRCAGWQSGGGGRVGCGKAPKNGRGKILRVSSNFDGVKRRANPPRLATAKATADANLGRLTAAKAAADAKGPEVIPADEDDEPIDDALLASTSKHRKVVRAMTGGKPMAIRKTAPGKSAKLRLGAAYDEMLAVTRVGTPTAMRLARDDEDDDNNEDVAMDLVRVTASSNDRFIGSLAPRAMTGDEPTAIRKTAPGTSAKLRLGVAYDETLAVTRACTPTAMRRTMDDEDDDEDEDVAMDLNRATASGDDCFIGGLVPRAMTGDKPTAICKTAPRTSAKLRLGAAYNETLVVARAGTPTVMRFTMDDEDDDHDKDVAMDLVRATASGNDRFIGGLAPTGRKFSVTSYCECNM
jgi:hypothetical protein